MQILCTSVDDVRVRIIGHIHWDKANPVQDVTNPKTLVTLLTNPGGAFEVAPSDPLMRLEDINKFQAAILVVEGITSPKALAAVKGKAMTALAAATNIPVAKLKGWAKSGAAETGQAAASTDVEEPATAGKE